MSDCLFCKIAAGEIPAKKVHEDEQFVAFEDINPQAPVHLLIIPRRHLAGLNDVTGAENELLGGVFPLARDLAMKRGVDQSGYRLLVNTGAGAGQSVFHIHFHLLGGRPMGWPPG